MRSTSSVAARAALAVALMIGFYLLALAIVAALLAIPALEGYFLDHVTGQIAVASVMTAGAILWSIIPRPDKFEDPGPRLTEAEHPRLFQAIRSVAEGTGQEMPAEVFLVAQVNAWVAERGGVMGFGSRRVMGLGLPLMDALTVSQFRAVLAHEFGHFHGGDTRLGPWIYKTRGAIERTLVSLHHRNSLVSRPFLWYGRTFVRITHAVSRRQEFIADALAARIVGARPLMDGLRALPGASWAFDAYWSEELAPVLSLGFHPPVADGFRRFRSAPRISAATGEATEQALANEAADPYDTHPTLRERVAAVEGFPAGVAPADDPRALTLLDRPDLLELELIRFLGGPNAPPLQPAEWEDLAERAWLPFWRERHAAYAAELAGLTPADLPAHAADLAPLAARLGVVTDPARAGAAEARQVAWVIGTALTVMLKDRGWQISALPGEDVVLRNGEDEVRPFSLMHDVDTGRLPGTEWLALCVRYGFAGADLGGAAVPQDRIQVSRRPAWSFVALEYYGLVLNRTYRVIVTETALCGAKVRGVMSAPISVTDAWRDPEFYPRPKLQARYAGIDPESPEFLAVDRANFQIAHGELDRVELSRKPKWGMGGVPYSGRILLHLRSGGTRDLVLLGAQDAEAIVERLQRYTSGVPAERVS